MSDITLSEMPFVLEGDITDPTTQTELYLIQNGDALTGLSTASDVESDSGTLNITSVQLYKDIVELQNNQTILVNAIEDSTVINGSNSNNYTSADLPEYITGSWSFVPDTLRIPDFEVLSVTLLFSSITNLPFPIITMNT